MDIDQEKIYFLKNQFWWLTISASFSRAYVYNPDANEKKKILFKNQLFEFIDDIVSKQYQNNHVTPENHVETILKIQKYSETFDVLDGQLKFGICQKLLNLYLKYLWSANYLEFTPPQFPLDRMIQEQSLKKVSTNWTTLNDSEKYSEILNSIHSGEDKAAWELIEYNNIIKKNGQTI